MHKLLLVLQNDFPELVFRSGEVFCWSPHEQVIVYKQDADDQAATWALLHEVGHALLDHRHYDSDLQLIELESQAWARAREIGATYHYQIDPDHIEDCMDTYRDWLHQRSACPVCDTRSLQQDARHYRCFNCGQIWAVTASRFCRPYRRKETQTKKSPQTIPSEATFA